MFSPSIMNDLKFAFRQLLKNPGFTAVAVLTLALGIGATTTVFSLIQGVLLTPPPYPQPDRLALIQDRLLDSHPAFAKEFEISELVSHRPVASRCNPV
jgi:hypothetical protein